MTEFTPPRGDQSSPAPKRVLGERYELDHVIGRGGMAEVWKARDIRLGRDVAVKRLRVDLATDPTFQARFRREAQSAAGLNHPNIVSTYDTGEEPDPSGVNVPWIVMELVEGHTLRDLLRQDRQIRPEVALTFSQGVLDALAYSHKAGIIHRDIKPANVMITPTGQVKVMDFGIARAVADTSATMTQTAAVIGTAQYLSPEQARGETVDNRSDVYAAGCLLYELLVGRPPFVGDSPVSVAYQHVREEPVPPSTLDPEVTPQMDAIVLKSLAKSPDDRYQDAKQMRDDITRLLAGEPVVATLPVAPIATTQAIPATPTAVTEVLDARSATSAEPVTGTLVADEFVEEQPERKKRGALTWIVITLLAALVALAGYGIWHFTRPASNSGMVMVTSYVGFPETQATQLLKRDGFTVQAKHVNGKNDSTVGNVTEQSPKDQEALRGSTVTITVNDGPVTNTVPKLLGLTEDEARKALKKVGFPDDQIKVVDATFEQEKTHLDYKQGQVVGTDPAEGAELVPGEQPITIALATGKSPVPNLQGLSLADATKAAQEYGFTIEQGDPVDDDNNVDKVAKQDPTSGEQERTKPITVHIGRAVTPVEPAKVSVPQLFGLDEAAAKARLKAAGFTGQVEVVKREVTDEAQNGKVLESAPQPGSPQSADQTVTIYVGQYVATAPTSQASSEAPSSDPSATESTSPSDTTSTPPASSTKPGNDKPGKDKPGKGNS